MKIRAGLVYGLNLIDLLCTLYALSMGCTELNPLMQSVELMVICKIFIIGAVCWWLSKQTSRYAEWGLNLCLFVYSALAGYHIVNIIFILVMFA